jgi:predicted phosphoribosyltransferase
MKAVLKALRDLKPKQVVLAVPVAASDSLRELAPLAEETVCLMAPEPFYSVGAFYHHFEQTTDEEVIDLLARATQYPENPPPH